MNYQKRLVAGPSIAAAGPNIRPLLVLVKVSHAPRERHSKSHLYSLENMSAKSPRRICESDIRTCFGTQIKNHNREQTCRQRRAGHDQPGNGKIAHGIIRIVEPVGDESVAEPYRGNQSDDQGRSRQGKRPAAIALSRGNERTQCQHRCEQPAEECGGGEEPAGYVFREDWEHVGRHFARDKRNRFHPAPR